MTSRFVTTLRFTLEIYKITKDLTQSFTAFKKKKNEIIKNIVSQRLNCFQHYAAKQAINDSE